MSKYIDDNMGENNTNNKLSFTEILLILACFASNLSQLPFFVETGTTQLISMPLWILLFFNIILKKYFILRHKNIKEILAIIIIYSMCIILEILTGNHYLNSGILWCFTMSLFFYFLGSFLSPLVSPKGYKSLFLFYVLSSLIVSIVIFNEFFLGKINLYSTVYAYTSKNSISQIILTSIIMLSFIKSEKTSKKIEIFKTIFVLFQVILLFLLRSRASILGLAIAYISLYFLKDISNVKKLKVFGFSILVFLGMLCTDVLSLFINNIIFASRSVYDLDSLSSGRISILKSLPYLMDESWLTGIGNTYFECFPLSVILNFGILLGPIILFVVYSPFFTILKLKKNSCDYKVTILFLLGIVYYINSIFEGLAPIGPGVKCYFFWLLLGFLNNKNTRCIKNE